MRAGPSNMQLPRLLRDSGCWGRIQNARRTVQHAASTAFAGFWMLGQDAECAPDRPTCSFHAFCRILDAGQDAECAPDRPTCSIHGFCGILDAAAGSRMRAGPSNIQFLRVLRDSGCCDRMQNAGRRMQDTGKRRLQQNPRVLRIQNPGLQLLFPLPEPPLTLPSGGCATASCDTHTAQSALIDIVF